MNSITSIPTVRERDWEGLEQALRKVPLTGDPGVLPYKEAKISSQVVEASEIYPIARYVLQQNLEVQEKLHRMFMEEHKIDTLDLNGKKGGVFFEVEGEEGEWLMSPPVVEISAADDNKPVLVDGEHRFMLAREYGQKVRVIWIEGVPEHVPVVALPIAWNEVEIFDEVPPLTQKRDFRYESLADFPDISGFSDVPLNEENFHYFFYRDLSGVCSSGIRPSGS